MMHEEELLLSALIDNELDAQETARVSRHLESCAGCRDAAARLTHMKAVLKAAPRRAMPPDLVAAIEARLEARPSLPARLGRLVSAPRVWAPAGALALAALLMSLWVRTLDRDPDQYVPLEPLLAAHSRYAAESLVPEDSLVAASYSAPDAGPTEQDNAE
jgi:anti-sigma factor RsiW